MKGLGKGLDALLGGYEEPNETAVSTLSVYLIDNNSDQPRKKVRRSEACRACKQHSAAWYRSAYYRSQSRREIFNHCR